MTTTAEDGELQRRQVRAAKNQSLFREVNERIEELRPDEMLIDFACECSDTDCTASLTLSIEEYESVRRFPTHFLVMPGHELDEVERVAEQNERYAVVEKFGAGGPAAVRLDPRARKARA
jgi:SpoU rRNA methylase family enzyme